MATFGSKVRSHYSLLTVPGLKETWDKSHLSCGSSHHTSPCPYPHRKLLPLSGWASASLSPGSLSCVISTIWFPWVSWPLGSWSPLLPSLFSFPSLLPGEGCPFRLDSFRSPGCALPYIYNKPPSHTSEHHVLIVFQAVSLTLPFLRCPPPLPVLSEDP